MVNGFRWMFLSLHSLLKFEQPFESMFVAPSPAILWYDWFMRSTRFHSQWTTIYVIWIIFFFRFVSILCDKTTSDINHFTRLFCSRQEKKNRNSFFLFLKYFRSIFVAYRHFIRYILNTRRKKRLCRVQNSSRTSTYQ